MLAGDPGALLAWNDGLLDGNATTSNPLCSAQWRTSHSWYYPPRALDLTMYAPLGTDCFSQNVTIQLLPYAHADDAPIDINPADDTPCRPLPAPTNPNDWQGCVLPFTWDPSSTPSWNQVDGAGDGVPGEADATFGWIVSSSS
jgi:hypothetical protein